MRPAVIYTSHNLATLYCGLAARRKPRSPARTNSKLLSATPSAARACRARSSFVRPSVHVSQSHARGVTSRQSDYYNVCVCVTNRVCEVIG